ncbi:MAG: hypothetical protein AAF700_11015 [Pseudomonadota bacterium]
MADLFMFFAFGAIVLYFGSFVRDVRRRKSEIAHRRSTLRYDEADQKYHWTTIDGASHSSELHPDKPGGVWFEAGQKAMDETRS